MNERAAEAYARRHVLVVVDHAQAKSLKWNSVRDEVAGQRGYLSLAFVDGADVNWIVPANHVDRVAENVTLPARVAPAEAGAAVAVIDKVFEAQSAVPDIVTTEIRLHGDRSLETQLFESLRGSSDIALRVFDKGNYRPGKAWPAATPAKPAGPPGTAPATKATTAAATAAATAFRAAAAKKSSAAAPTSATAAGTSANSPSPKPPARGGGFRERYRPWRRLFAGLFAVVGVQFGVFAGFVLSSIWGYSLSNMPTIVETIVTLQSDAFGVSLIAGAIVAVLGPRARWLPFASFLYGILAGWLPATVPLFVVIAAPPFLRKVFENAAGFWGEGLAWAAILSVGAGCLVSYWSVKCLPPLDAAVRDARTRRRASIRRFLGMRSPVDRWAIGLLITFALTFIVPWLVGRFVLQDNILLTRGAGVFDADAREFWPYFWPLYLGGLAALLLAFAAALVLQPWPGRYGLVILGVVAIAGGLLLGNTSAGLWRSAESATATRLTTTAFPYTDHYYSCGSAQLSLPDAGGRPALFQVYTAQISDSGVDGCNRVVAYEGWQRLGQTDAPANVTVTDGPTLTGTTLADAVVSYTLSTGEVVQRPLSSIVQP